MGILDDAIREHLELKRRHGATDDELSRQEAEALGPARRQGGGDAAYEVPERALPPPDPDDAASLIGDGPPPPDPDAATSLIAEVPLIPGDAVEPEPAAFDDLDEFEDPDDPAGAEPAAYAAPHPEPALDQTEVFDEPLHAEPSDLDPIEPPLATVEPDLEPEAELEPDPGPDDDPFDPPTQIAHDDATRVRPTVPIHDDPSLPPEPALPPHAREPEPELEPEPDLEPSPPPSSAPAADDGEDVLEETPEFLQDTPEHDRLWFEQKPPRDFDFDD